VILALRRSLDAVVYIFSPYFPWSFLVAHRWTPDYNGAMKDMHVPRTYGYDFPARYRIRVRGKIKTGWADQVEGMTISLETRPDGTPETTLEGELRDQSSVFGVLHTLYEQHLELLFVLRLTGDSEVQQHLGLSESE
jgi:hypothetical protein